MFVVPADTPGIEIVRNVPVYGHGDDAGTHSYIRYENVRIPRDHLLGDRGQGFVVAQTRLGGGRIHHAMRTVGRGAASVRHDVRAGALTDHEGRDCSPASSSSRR